MKRVKNLAVGLSAFLIIVAGGCGGSSSGGGGTPPPSGSVSVTISPTSGTVGFGGQQQFTATVTGTTNTAVTWTVSSTGGTGAQIGTISSSGLYKAPSIASLPTTGLPPNQVSVTAGNNTQNINVTGPTVNAVNSVTVAATSQADSSKSASATVTLSGLSLIAVGQCTQNGTTLNCQGGGTGVEISRSSATVSLFVAGYGVVPGTTFSISGNDVVVPPPSSPSYVYTTTTDGLPAVVFQITISPTATLGPRNILVTSSGGELSAFPGGLLITQ